jgi:hypothetical protein
VQLGADDMNQLEEKPEMHQLSVTCISCGAGSFAAPDNTRATKAA